ncbi:MAG: hypothetical protein ACLP9L_21045 [Thermoguttaceae bacterium]
MKIDLENRTALVTGAARNIGKAIGDTPAANGARVVNSDVGLAEVTADGGVPGTHTLIIKTGGELSYASGTRELGTPPGIPQGYLGHRDYASEGCGLSSPKALSIPGQSRRHEG